MSWSEDMSEYVEAEGLLNWRREFCAMLRGSRSGERVRDSKSSMDAATEGCESSMRTALLVLMLH